MNILLAGGTGFIGSHILMKLLEKGHTVEAFARNPNKIPALHGMKGVTLTQGDITDSAAAEKALAGKDACVYVALNYNDQNASAMLRSDTLTTVSWADAAAKAGVKKFIYTSSASANDYVYKTDPPRIEGGKINSIYENTKQNPVSYYGAGKAATENFLNAISYETLVLEDRGWSDDVILFDVTAIKRDFNLEFHSWEKLKQHICYHLSLPATIS